MVGVRQLTPHTRTNPNPHKHRICTNLLGTIKDEEHPPTLHLLHLVKPPTALQDPLQVLAVVFTVVELPHKMASIRTLFPDGILTEHTVGHVRNPSMVVKRNITVQHVYKVITRGMFKRLQQCKSTLLRTIFFKTDHGDKTRRQRMSELVSSGRYE